MTNQIGGGTPKSARGVVADQTSCHHALRKTSGVPPMNRETNMTPITYHTTLPSPLGELLALSDGEHLTGLYLPNHKGGPRPNSSWQTANAPFAALRTQLAEYFAGERHEFDVPLRLAGTPFQQQVWQQLTRIPYGATITYAELALRIGSPAASRAVGAANGRNPISILVPCHRVVGATGKLTGYAGGVDKKEWLLAMEREAEGVNSQRSLFARASS
jgi:methylated-DNA-[protein]-cysteine S-methyltransferase